MWNTGLKSKTLTLTISLSLDSIFRWDWILILQHYSILGIGPFFHKSSDHQFRFYLFYLYSFSRILAPSNIQQNISTLHCMLPDGYVVCTINKIVNVIYSSYNLCEQNAEANSLVTQLDLYSHLLPPLFVFPCVCRYHFSWESTENRLGLWGMSAVWFCYKGIPIKTGDGHRVRCQFYGKKKIVSQSKHIWSLYGSLQ